MNMVSIIVTITAMNIDIIMNKRERIERWITLYYLKAKTVIAMVYIT